MSDTWCATLKGQYVNVIALIAEQNIIRGHYIVRWLYNLQKQMNICYIYIYNICISIILIISHGVWEMVDSSHVIVNLNLDKAGLIILYYIFTIQKTKLQFPS